MRLILREIHTITQTAFKDSEQFPMPYLLTFIFENTYFILKKDISPAKDLLYACMSL